MRAGAARSSFCWTRRLATFSTLGSGAPAPEGGVEGERFEDLLEGRALVLNVGWSLLEAGLGGAGSEDVAENVEANLFADVELNQDQDGAAEGRRNVLFRTRRGFRLG